MNELALTLLARGYVEDAAGRQFTLHSHTSRDQAAFLEEQVRNIDATVTLEIGLAYGISALCIAQAIRHQPGARHIVIDPNQNSESWQGLGLLNLKRSGLSDIIDFREQPAQIVLPALVTEGVRIDFAYIDAGKRMDDILIFVHYLGRLLRVGGVMAFDDLTFPGIRKALRYIVQQDHLTVKASFGTWRPSMLRGWMSAMARRFPGGDRVLASELLRPDQELGISASCVAIEKVAEPTNDWQWHTIF